VAQSRTWKVVLEENMQLNLNCYLACIKFLRGTHYKYPLCIITVFICMECVSIVLVDNFTLTHNVFILFSLLLNLENENERQMNIKLEERVKKQECQPHASKARISTYRSQIFNAVFLKL